MGTVSDVEKGWRVRPQTEGFLVWGGEEVAREVFITIGFGFRLPLVTLCDN